MAISSFKFPKSVKRRLKEMTASFGSTTNRLGLRNSIRALQSSFFEAPTSPALRDTRVDRDACRSLYYNKDLSINNGAFVARPIVDGCADYIGLPILSVKDESTDELINGWVNEYWQHSLWEAYRNSLREADTWVRLRKPFPGPISSPDENDVITLEVIDSDRVTPYRNPATGELIRVEILTRIYIEDEPFNPLDIYATGLHSHGREHDIVEIITPSQFLYYDATDNILLENYTVENEWNFVPCVQFFNDFDSALNGGMSELENVYPFFQALHDVVIQTRTSHKYMANPKVKFKLDDVISFLKNNFPQSFDTAGNFTGKVSWRDLDVFFMEQEDDASFVEATMNTNDSVALMEFLLDCICMAAETPESIMFRARAESVANNDEWERFKTKVHRKRSSFEGYIQQVVQMGLAIVLQAPKRPTISWPTIDVEDEVSKATALNQVVTGAEVANRAQVISKNTYRQRIKQFFPAMKDTDEEVADIDADVQKENQQQIDLEKKMQAIQPKTNFNGNTGGVNGLDRSRSRLPTDVAPPPASG